MKATTKIYRMAELSTGTRKETAHDLDCKKRNRAIKKLRKAQEFVSATD